MNRGMVVITLAPSQNWQGKFKWKWEMQNKHQEQAMTKT